MPHDLPIVAHHEAGHAIVLATVGNVKSVALECRDSIWFGIVHPCNALVRDHDALVAFAGVLAESRFLNGGKALSPIDLKTLRDDFLEYGAVAKPKMYELCLADGILDIKQSELDAEKVHESLSSIKDKKWVFLKAANIVASRWQEIEQLAKDLIASAPVLHISGQCSVSLNRHLISETQFEWR